MRLYRIKPVTVPAESCPSRRTGRPGFAAARRYGRNSPEGGRYREPATVHTAPCRTPPRTSHVFYLLVPKEINGEFLPGGALIRRSRRPGPDHRPVPPEP